MREFSTELISRYIDDDLSPEERAEVEALLDSNPQARELCAELREFGSALRALPAAKMNANLAHQVLQEIQPPASSSTETIATYNAGPSRIWRSASWLNIAAAVAVLLAAVTYMVAGPFGGRSREFVQLDEPLNRDLARQHLAGGFSGVSELEINTKSGKLGEIVNRKGDDGLEDAHQRIKNLPVEAEVLGDAVAGRSRGLMGASQSEFPERSDRGGRNARTMQPDKDSSREQMGADSLAKVHEESDHVEAAGDLPAMGFENLSVNPSLMIVHVDVAESAWRSEAFRQLLQQQQIIWAEGLENEPVIAGTGLRRRGRDVRIGGELKESEAEMQSRGEVKHREDRRQDDRDQNKQHEIPTEAMLGTSRQDYLAEGFGRLGTENAEELARKNLDGLSEAEVQFVYVEAEAAKINDLLSALQSHPSNRDHRGTALAQNPADRFRVRFSELEGVLSNGIVSPPEAAMYSQLGQQIQSYYFTRPQSDEQQTATQPPVEFQDQVTAGIGGGGMNPPVTNQQNTGERQARQQDAVKNHADNNKAVRSDRGDKETHQASKDQSSNDRAGAGTAQAQERNEAVDGGGRGGETPSDFTQPGNPTFFYRLSAVQIQQWLFEFQKNSARIHGAAGTVAFDELQDANFRTNQHLWQDSSGEAIARQKILFVLRKVDEPPIRAPDPSGR
ncbi:MAG: hypothetical protein MPJ50_06915 [Pirellulales bacterium]|nr:hypothetical protein [Pirellulales bacterium]